MPSLADQLAKLANPEPVDFDPEDFENRNPDDDSGNELEVNKAATEHYLEVSKSSLRNDELNVDGVKYVGKRVKRDALFEQNGGHSEESDDDDEEEVEGEDDSEEEEEEEEDSEENDVVNGNESEEEDEMQSDDDISEKKEQRKLNGSASDGVPEDEVAKRAQLQELIDAERKNLAGRLSNTAKADAEKGSAVQHQLNIYESIIDCRIKLQKSIQAVNELPISRSSAEKFTTEATPELISKNKESVFDLLNKVSQLRLRLLQKDGLTDLPKKLSKKRSLTTAFENAQSLDKPLYGYRESVLTKWSQKVQSSTGSMALQSSKFKSLNQTAAIQVSTVLADMERLVKRTKLNRSNVKALGLETVAEDQEKQAKTVDIQEEDHIFDDTDFYRQILKELVDRRMADSGNTAGLKWTVTKAKVKKNIDTKASKGRKLRYTVQEKVQGFDVPRHTTTWTDEQIDDLFASLLGQKIKIDENDNSDAEEDKPEEEPENDGLQIFG
ncbi:Bfr2p [Sugiyamaella lignohabitans]|uniref:Protein BFR2 n=1 Tax=Sugiyamaella lignohabitans TaxID=796027 RepID=A0A167E858_9ASCO|nr:Bfr2p [Sugiyamaella lignohabitans]ANB13759.1 Bfr2p [Sugiyamaella lignohabitans]